VVRGNFDVGSGTCCAPPISAVLRHDGGPIDASRYP
jgi:hypothetical protein